MATVLVFDSGVGGLSVYQDIRCAFPELDFVYACDNAAYPYGELDPQLLIKRVNLIVDMLVKQHQVDAVVIACNTASTLVLPSLRSFLTIPVIGVVPAIKPACQVANIAVGLIATPATVKRDYTDKLINEFSHGVAVYKLGSSQLVHMAEAKLRGEAVNLQELEQIVSPFMNKIDAAVLGCTHFPLIREELDYVFNGKVQLIDSGKAVAKQVGRVLGIEAGNGKADIAKEGHLYSSAPMNITGALELYLTSNGLNPKTRHLNLHL